MNKILVPYDFSDVALHALNFAADVARKTSDCSVTVINIIEHPTPDSFHTTGVIPDDPMENLYLKKLIETTESKMSLLMGDSKYKDIDLKYKIVIGNPFKEISEEIKTQGVELVIMGTEGTSGAEEFLVGSNAERMVRYSKCPVITLSEATEASAIKNIVLASDFDSVPKSFVDHIKKLKALFGASLKLVKINTPSSFTTTRQDNKQMKEFVTDFGLTDCPYETYNASNEEDGIIEFAEDEGADMIALATSQRRGLRHFLSGSIAEDVVNHAKVPVWTFGLEN